MQNSNLDCNTTAGSLAGFSTDANWGVGSVARQR